MENQIETRVCIVGAGPTGLTLAAELQRYGVRCVVVEQRRDRTTESKAFALHARSLEVFKRMGVHEPLLEHGLAVKGMAVWSGRQRVLSGDLTMLETEFPYVLSIPQANTESVLLDHWLEKGGRLLSGHQVRNFQQSEREVTVETLNGKGETLQIKCEWLVGCDGAHSTVRRLGHFGWRGDDYDFEFLVADGKIDWSGDSSGGHTFLSRKGYVMLFPLPEERHRIVVNVKVGQFGRESLSVNAINNVLRERGLGDIHFHSPFWLSSTQGRRRVADRYKKGRVLLAGDAAHVHSPLGGQGLNTGIQDAYQLAWRLAAIAPGATANQIQLDDYERERRQVALDVLRNTDKLTRLFTSRSPLIFALRKWVLPVLSRLPRFNHNVACTASGLATKLVRPALYLRGLLEKDFSGTRLVHAKITDLSNRQQILAEDVIGLDGHELVILLGQAHTQAFYEAKRLLAELLSTEAGLFRINSLKRVSLVATSATHYLLPTLSSETKIRRFLDEEEAFFNYYAIEDTGYLLVRPDGYVAFGGALQRADDLLQNLHSVFDMTISSVETFSQAIPVAQCAEV